MIATLALTAILAQAKPVNLFPNDADLHFSISAAGAGINYAGISFLTKDRNVRLAFAFGMPMSAGFGREFTQALQTGRWTRENTKDMAINAAGAAFGAAFSFAVDCAINREEDECKQALGGIFR